MWFSQQPLVRLSYLAPVALTAGVSIWLALPWWGLAALAGTALLAWDWLWGFDILTQASTPWLMALAGSLALVASLLLASGLGLTLGEFVELRASAPRRADWLYWLPGMGLASVVYGMVLLCLQRWGKR